MIVTATAHDVAPWRSLVRHLARGVARRYLLPVALDVQDLEQLGLLAAQRALEDYDPARGTTLRTWVANRVRWHLVDVAREGTRSRRARVEPRPGLRDDAAGAVVDHADPTRRAELRDEVRAAFRRLSAQSQLALWLYYAEGRPLREVGRRLGVGESRACQILAAAFRRLGRPRPLQRHRGLALPPTRTP